MAVVKISVANLAVGSARTPSYPIQPILKVSTAIRMSPIVLATTAILRDIVEPKLQPVLRIHTTRVGLSIKLV
jgi:hypothetical protein